MELVRREPGPLERLAGYGLSLEAAIAAFRRTNSHEEDAHAAALESLQIELDRWLKGFVTANNWLRANGGAKDLGA